MLSDLVENKVRMQPENPCAQGLEGSAKKVLCPKTCGSHGCKRDFLKQRCPGIYQGVCVGIGEKSKTDREQANACIENDVNMGWLTKNDTRSNTPIKKVNRKPPKYQTDSSHLSNERYFHPY